MTKEQAIEKAGSARKLAALLGITTAAISQWKNVPQARVWQLRVLHPEWFRWGFIYRLVVTYKDSLTISAL